MSQSEIIKALEKKKEPLTSKELSVYLSIRQETILKNLKKLLQHKEIKSRKPTEKEMRAKGYDGHNMNSRWRVFFLEGCAN